MTAVRGQPPGRAGRVWLRRRLEVAERGCGLLETKLRILAAEEQRFDILAERTRSEWAVAVADAERWMARARLLSGRRGVRFAAPVEPAGVDVRWEATMGVRYPARAMVQPGQPAPDAATPDSSALVLAREAYVRALHAGADHAVATQALAEVRGEVFSTRRRLRALQRRWTPRLGEAQHALADALEEAEREDGVRLRWVSGRRESPAAGSTSTDNERGLP